MNRYTSRYIQKNRFKNILINFQKIDQKTNIKIARSKIQLKI